MTPEEKINILNQEIVNLKREVQSLKEDFYYNRFSKMEVKTKDVQFNGNIGFYKKFPIAQAGAIASPDTSGAQLKVAVDLIRTALTNIGITG